MIGRAVAAAYVVVVAGVAAFGFATDSTAAILLAAALALPSGLPALVAYYAAYGVLALVPGANPSESSGSVSCTVDARCATTSAGDAALWFTTTTDALGVAALAAAAVTNVLLWRLVHRRARRRQARPT